MWPLARPVTDAEEDAKLTSILKKPSFVSANFDARFASGVQILRIRLRFQQARRFLQRS